MKHSPTIFAVLTALAISPSTLSAQQLVEQDKTKWTLVNPIVSSMPQFKFDVTKDTIKWSAIRGRDWRLLAGASTVVTVSAALANQPLLLDVQTYGGITGIQAMTVKLGTSLSYVERQRASFVHQQVVQLPQGTHKLEVLAAGSNFYENDVNLITNVSLEPMRYPAVVWRFPADFNDGPWWDITLHGTKSATAVLFFSPTRFGASGPKIPGIDGSLWLSAPQLIWVQNLDARGTASFQPSAADWMLIRRSVSTASYWQVLEAASTKLSLGSLTTLQAR